MAEFTRFIKPVDVDYTIAGTADLQVFVKGVLSFDAYPAYCTSRVIEPL